ncbi:MAG: tail fiber domain-containing protein [Acidobacteriota bacterium]
MNRLHGFVFLLAAAALLVLGAPAMAADVADESLTPSALTLTVSQAHDGGQLVVSGPGGRIFESAFAAGEAARFDLSTAEGVVPDGVYSWTLRTRPVVTDSQRALLDELRASGDQERLIELREAGKLPSGSVAAGTFSIRNGLPVDGTLIESSVASEGSRVDQADGFLAEEGTGVLTEAAQVINNDLVVVGSTCTGLDCVNGESFGFDTLRLKENNLRIHFQDTSNSASFPTTDWRLEANETTNGGKNRFSIVDADTGRAPFTVEGGAPANSLYVEDGGRVGLGTSTPIVELHVANGDTPTLRLEQDGSSGFTPQTWDVAGNEAGFFVRDVTNGSQLAFRILPGNSEGTLALSNNRVGVGTISPAQTLHVRATNGTAQLLVEEANVSAGNSVLVRVENDGGNVQTEYVPNGGTAWRQNFRNNSLDFDFQDADANEFTINTDGDLTVSGSVSAATTVSAAGMVLTSDRNLKTNILDVDPGAVLSEISAMPISTWVLKADDTGARHIGPMAQDFHAAFGFGSDDVTISPQDTASVALVGVQALKSELEERDERIHALEAANATLLERLEALEAKLAE